VTSKLDDVIDSNLNLSTPQRKKRPPKKGEVPNYGIDIEDEVEDMGLGDLFEQPILPESEKQIVPKPPVVIICYGLGPSLGTWVLSVTHCTWRGFWREKENRHFENGSCKIRSRSGVEE